MSKVFLGVHIVFATKYRQRTIPLDKKRNLYAYIHSILEDRKCKTFRINGVGDHVHIAIDLSPNIALSDLVRDLKRSSSHFMTGPNGFPDFVGWGTGYFAESFSMNERDAVITYIKKQEDHHLSKALQEELKWLVTKSGMRYFADDWK